jgi:Flp pilus assembly protein TadD
MATRFGVPLAVLFASLILYLASLNPSAVQFALAPGLRFDVSLWALLLLVAAFSVLATIVVMLLRDTARALAGPRAVEKKVQPEGGAAPRVAAETPPREEHPAVAFYTAGKTALEAGNPKEAIRQFKEAIRADKEFAPAYLLMGEAYERTGEPRDAARTWERGVEMAPLLPLLGKLERMSRAEGRPTRMIALYQEALARHPGDQALAFHLGRVYFELAMLDDAADQFRKIEVTLPDLPQLHAYLGAISERRGEIRRACEEYEHALKLSRLFEWPYRCAGCGATTNHWQDRCGVCGKWNSLRA